jgi:hypothetical protein
MLTYIRMSFLYSTRSTHSLKQKTSKIYTFDYKRKWWNPWARWPATVKAYHWADIHGEMRFSSDRYTGGFQLFASVCQPGTLNVTERFQIASGSPAQLQQLWSYLCLYMQGEPCRMRRSIKVALISGARVKRINGLQKWNVNPLLRRTVNFLLSEPVANYLIRRVNRQC